MRCRGFTGLQICCLSSLLTSGLRNHPNAFSIYQALPTTNRGPSLDTMQLHQNYLVYIGYMSRAPITFPRVLPKQLTEAWGNAHSSLPYGSHSVTSPVTSLNPLSSKWRILPVHISLKPSDES